MSNFIYNDTLYKNGEPVITADNPSFRYGDGVFETIRVEKGKIQLARYHFERLFEGLEKLQLSVPPAFTASFLESRIMELCRSNEHDPARVRVTVFSDDGSLNDSVSDTGYIIQTWPLESINFNKDGLVLGSFGAIQKNCDAIANCKTNNFLPYLLAARHAKKMQWDDCLVLNNHGRVCDTTIANIFLIKNNIIYTPSLDEGCIAGVMRRYLLFLLKNAGYSIIEKPIEIKEVEDADEVFLTNVIKGIRWVRQFANSSYTDTITQTIWQHLFESDR